MNKLTPTAKVAQYVVGEAFASAPGRLLHAAVHQDFSKLEERVVLIQAQARILRSESGEDVHKRKAAELFGVPYDEVTAQQRAYAKIVNYAGWYTPNGAV